jgi:hypothetical protein
VESKITVGHEVSSDFLKSIVRSFHGGKNVHFESIFGSVESGIIDGYLQGVKFIGDGSHEFMRVGSWSFNGKTEKSRVSEVVVNWGSSVNEVIGLHNR